MSHRSTYSLAQLFLLTMLSGLICAWLPKAVEWDDQHWDYARFQAKLSADASRLISFDSSYGFAVFDTVSGKCLLRRELGLEGKVNTDCDLNIVLTFHYSKQKKKFRFTLYDVVTQEDLHGRPLEPLPDHRSFPAGCDDEGLLVQVDYWPIQGNEALNFEKPATVRHWDPKTGNVVEQYTTGGCRHLDFLESCPGGGMFFLGHLAKPAPDLACFVEWRDENGFRRTKIPPRGSFSPSPICISASGDRALLYQTHGLSGQPEGPHSLLLCLRETGEIRDLGTSDFASIRPAQFTADNKDLIGVGEEFGGYNLRLIKMDLATMEWSDLDYMPAKGISDLKLIDGGRSLAVATNLGDFHVIDLATGNTLRHKSGLRYHPPRVIWYVLGGTAAVWLALWWRATRAVPNEPVAWGRYQGLLMFFVALFVGLLLLGYRDERLRKIHVPTISCAVAVTLLLAIVGAVCIFLPKCNKLDAIFTLVSCLGILTYLGWLTYRTF